MRVVPVNSNVVILAVYWGQSEEGVLRSNEN